MSSQTALIGYYFVIYCHRPKYNFSGTPVTCFLSSFRKLVVNPVDSKYQKGQSMDNCIILLCNSNYKRRWNNVIFLQGKYKINALS
jgi:hypothetical protein